MATMGEDHRVMEKGISQNSSKRRKGGFRTLPFIIANEALEKVPSFALLPSMTLYVRANYNFTITQSHNLISLWQAFSNFTPILGAFFSDSYMGRFVTIGLGSISSFLGVVILWFTTIIPNVRPPPCDRRLTQSCKSATPGQLSILIIALIFKSIGAGGIRPCSMPFGAEQLTNSSEKALESYFSWYYAAATLGASLGLTVVVYILQTYGWTVGYGVCAALMLLATLSFYVASSLYIKRKASTSLFTGFAQVLVASYKKRDLPSPSQKSDYHIGKATSSEITVPSDKLTFLNKACMKRNVEEEIGPDGLALDPWRLCTVHKVEELKALLKVMPIWSTAIMMGIVSNQHTFPVLQASTMNRHIFGGSFEIPAASLSVFLYGSIVVWICLYERVIIPLASKIMGKQVYISATCRMGIGLFLSAVSMGLNAVVENSRLSKAHQEGKLESSGAIVNMSVLWLLPQNILMGVSESLNSLGQFEFYHREFPKTMSSIGNSLFFLSIAVGYILNITLFNIINQTTSRGGSPSWVADNLNEARFDYYYWILTGLSLLNLFYYIICVSAYGKTSNVVDEGYVSEEE